MCLSAIRKIIEVIDKFVFTFVNHVRSWVEMSVSDCVSCYCVCAPVCVSVCLFFCVVWVCLRMFVVCEFLLWFFFISLFWVSFACMCVCVCVCVFSRGYSLRYGPWCLLNVYPVSAPVCVCVRVWMRRVVLSVHPLSVIQWGNAPIYVPVTSTTLGTAPNSTVACGNGTNLLFAERSCV
jgi:hypothetical protein